MDPEVLVRPPRPPHPTEVSPPPPPMNASTRLCPRWRCPKTLTLNQLFISPPGFLSSSSSCQLCLVSGRKGGRPRTGGPHPAESLLNQESFHGKESFFCESPLGSGCELRITPQRPRLTFAQSPHVEYCEALFKGSSNNYNDKKKKLIC